MKHPVLLLCIFKKSFSPICNIVFLASSFSHILWGICPPQCRIQTCCLLQQNIITALKNIIVQYPFHISLLLHISLALFTILTKGHCIGKQRQKLPEGNMASHQINGIADRAHCLHTAFLQKSLYIFLICTTAIARTFPVRTRLFIRQKLLHNLKEFVPVLRQITILKIADINIFPSPGQFLHEVDIIFYHCLGKHADICQYYNLFLPSAFHDFLQAPNKLQLFFLRQSRKIHTWF